MNFPIEATARFDMGFANRYLRACKLLGYSSRARLVHSSLMLDDTRWSVSALSEWTGYSRVSVTSDMSDLRAMKWAIRRKNGWVLTLEGYESLSWLHAEVLAIANQSSRSFSSDLMDLLDAMNRRKLSRKWSIPRKQLI